MRPKVAQFCGVYDNVFRMMASEAGDGNYIQEALVEHHVEYGTKFTLLHCCEVLKECAKWKDVVVPDFEEIQHEKSKRYKSSNSSSGFNTSQSVSGGFDLNLEDEDDENEDFQEVQRLVGRNRAKAQKKKGAASLTSAGFVNEERLARLMVNDYRSTTETLNNRKQ